MYRPRSLEDKLRAASAQFPVLLLAGPRQVGKTTLLRHLAEDERRYVSLDDPAARELATEDPALFLQSWPAPLLIDEVQYAPQLLPHIKMAVDEARTPGAYWLTGSQQFHLMRDISETLAGRLALVSLLGFSHREIEGRRLTAPPYLPLVERLEGHEGVELASLYRHIWLGSFPALVTGQVQDRDLFYSSYVATYLQRDVRDLTQVGDLSAFTRFLRAVAARTGQLLNLSDLARDVDISQPTAKAWLSVLEASWQVVLLQPWHSNLTKRLVKTPKLYMLDTGLASWLTRWSSAETLSAGAMAGPMLETWVVAEVLKSWWHRMATPPVYHYRDHDKREIDLLFETDGALWPTEIKRSASARRSWTKTFGALERLGPERGSGAVLSLVPDVVPLGAKDRAAPVGLI
jgi:predicted AAA+ superfamily ATPase